MNSIVLTVALVSAIGLVGSVVLVFASKKLAVEEDERLADVVAMLPGANYLYLARPESAPSVLDILPPNFALRTGIIVAVITLMFFLAYLPWLVKDRKAKAAVQNA